MKNNKTKIYAEALAEVILDNKTSEKKTVDNFLKLLTKTGQEKKAKEILTLAEDIILKKEGKRRIFFQMARPLAATPASRGLGAAKAYKDLMQAFVKEGDVVSEKVDPELIAGIKIVINNEKQLDNTMLSKINKI